jgi:hypothetical protein
MIVSAEFMSESFIFTLAIFCGSFLYLTKFVIKNLPGKNLPNRLVAKSSSLPISFAYKFIINSEASSTAVDADILFSCALE